MDEIEFSSGCGVSKTSELSEIITHNGCSGNHEFELKKHISKSTVKLWLFKKASNKLCDRYILEERTFNLSDKILNSETINLITPVNESIKLKYMFV